LKRAELETRRSRSEAAKAQKEADHCKGLLQTLEDETSQLGRQLTLVQQQYR
jgi:hypothetical protein